MRLQHLVRATITLALLAGAASGTAAGQTVAPALVTRLEHLTDAYWAARQRGDTAAALALQVSKGDLYGDPALGTVDVPTLWMGSHERIAARYRVRPPGTIELHWEMAPGTATPGCMGSTRLPLVLSYARLHHAWRISAVLLDLASCM